MTDNEIYRALECCRNKLCIECPRGNNKEHTALCQENLIRYAFDLINRQKAEIENLRDILYDADGVNLVNYWYQQCKIAENGCRNFEEENENLKAEIERLTAFKSYFDGLYGKGLDVANWHENGELEPFDNFYDDAVKEMVDKNND